MPKDNEDYTVEDFTYVHHGDRAMGLRLFRPIGEGPFPVVVDLHGGAWNKGTLEECGDRDAYFAKTGIAAASLDFRQAADGYPSSSADINYAIRWLKAKAGELNLDPARVGVTGQSSGGHLAMLAGMRPNDARYSAIALPEGSPAVDASVKCIGMTWPVINPLSRYRHAVRLRASDDTPGWVGDIPERHDTYWGTEDAMAEGNPMLMLENGEAVETPPAVWVQGRPDPVHDYRDPDSPLDLNEPERFAANYRNAGGQIEIVDIDYATRVSEVSFKPLADFFAKNL
jgi:acetyl esterase